MTDKYRMLPKVDEILNFFEKVSPDKNREYVKLISNNVLEKYRLNIKKNADFSFDSQDIFEEIKKFLEEDDFYSFKETINATGVVLHTNLGRAPLSDRALTRLNQLASSYSNLEYDLENGKRGSRYNQVVDLVKKLTGSEDAIIVNNNAAAVFLMLNTLAFNKETIVSRGELVEIGDSFRISSIMEKSGSKLVEVGATNRTHLWDYENKINDETKILMKVHASNYRVIGFYEAVSAPELKELAKNRDLYVIEDLGSGSLIDLSDFGLSHERTVSDCIKEGIDLVSFSCDKLLGGPQGGIICGRKELIDEIKKNQLLRAFRVCKLTLAALEATLIEYIDVEQALMKIPTLRMLSIGIDEIEKKAEDFGTILKGIENLNFSIEDTFSLVGGGAYPNEKLKSKGIFIDPPKGPNDLEEFLRKSKYHIVTNIYKDKVILDLRTIREDDYEKIYEVLEDYFKKI